MKLLYHYPLLPHDVIDAIGNHTHTYRGHVPVPYGPYVRHEVMPGCDALHVDVGLVPQRQDILVQLFSSAGQRTDQLSFCQKSQGRDVNPSFSPCRRINGLFVGRRDGEAHRGDHGLVPGRVDDLPLGPVSVTGQHALIVFSNGDLAESHVEN